jgi:hypothetical protein
VVAFKFQCSGTVLLLSDLAGTRETLGKVPESLGVGCDTSQNGDYSSRLICASRAEQVDFRRVRAGSTLL